MVPRSLPDVDKGEELAEETKQAEKEQPPNGASGADQISVELIPRPQTGLTRLTPLQQYLAEIRQFKPLSADEEHRLAVQYREHGDQAAGYRLVTANLGLVVKIARIYARAYHNVIDLIQEGNIGLIEAVKRFDPYKGNRLPTYASWWIKAYIIKFVLDNFRIVRVGTTNERRRLLFNLRKEKEDLRQQGIEPTHELLAERLNVSEDDVRAVEANIESSDLPLDAKVGEDGSLHYADMLEAAEEQVDERLARGELQRLFNEKLAEFSRNLNERELVILKERLVSDHPKTLQEIADQFGVTREAIRLNEKSLVTRIKKYMEEALRDVTQVEIALLA
jgi:RNA polymerase sigma-32 factor